MPEQPPSYYDAAFSHPASRYNMPWKDAAWADLWRSAAEAIGAAPRVIDLGCGPGHLGECLRDLGWRGEYLGIDFSATAVEMARERVDGVFVHGDIAYAPLDVGATYVALEVLEHIVHDLFVLRRIPAGAKLVISVPNYPSGGHVRHFGSIADACARYDAVGDWSKKRVVPLRPGREIYLLAGSKK